MLISVLGYYLPYLFAAPYFFVVWRMLIGHHMQTDAKLFIGQMKREFVISANSPTSSDTLSHWIVAYTTGESSDDYLVAHAVGEVISGHGIVRHFESKAKEEIEQKYSLHHVGWVTRKEREHHQEQVQKKEPMASGYTCQEFAVDIAFQISSSRTYTFMKSVMLFRWRTVVYFVLAALSIAISIVESYTNEPTLILVVPINLKFFNFAMITNLFVATEAYRLGFTNVRRERNFLGGLKDRYHVYFKVPSYVDMFKLIVLSIVAAGVQICFQNTMLTIGFFLIAIIMATN